MALPRITVDNAYITFRNFEGRIDGFGNAGKRFGVRLDEAMAQQLVNDGWPVKVTQPGENDEREPYPYVVVNVGYKQGAPRVAMYSSTGRVDLGENDIGVLDWVDIEKADVLFQLADWEFNGKTGKKAWLKTLVIHINEDELEAKYGLNGRSPNKEEIPS